jgi:O-methyltransferase domain/Dimerisation domain
MSTVNPAQTVMELARAYWSSRCLHVVAELGVADALDEMPRTAAELAARTRVNGRALHRVLRALVSRGIFDLKDGRFSHNDASRLLRTGTEGSLRASARVFGLPVWWSSYGALEHCLRTAKPAVASVNGQGMFAHLGAHPHEAAIFAEAMLALAHAQIPLILKSYDFRDAKIIGDIGGGLGHLLAAVLAASPQAEGILFDRPEVIEKASATPAARIRYVAGDFFRDRIPACDIYLVKGVLHDWSDAEAVTILQNIRAGAPQGARILLLEGVLDEYAPGVLAELDIEMLVMTGGRERTQEDWKGVLTEAGVTLRRILPTGTPLSAIIEAVVP